MNTEQSKTKVIRFWANTWHCRKPEANAVGVKERLQLIHPDGSVEWKDNLEIYHDPIRPFWITLPQYRNHDYKKEFESLDRCEKFLCHDSALEETIAKALGNPLGYRKPHLRVLCNSPYVYGADIDTPTIIKQTYVRRVPVGKVATYTKGGLDIEAEVRGDHRINIITFIHEKEIYTTALREYCKVHSSETDSTPATEEDCLKVIYEMLDFYFKEHGFTLHFHIAETELEEIKWIFNKIHLSKTDYIGVWNLGFDIPHILERIAANGGDAAEIMCHPDVPHAYQFCEWTEDKTPTQHFTDKWHWLTLPGYSQFLDSMCLYARLRKVSGRESSYSLDDISTKEIGKGKLHFGDITNHWYMQNRRFLEYIAYNINDVIIMQLMEWQNNDMGALAALSGMSLLSHFSRQTVMVKNDAYAYGLDNGKVPATAGLKMFTDFDNRMPKAGGTVLPPNKAVGTGINAVKEFNRQTQVSVLTNDLDVSSMYPSITSAFNISKETAQTTVLKINGHQPWETEVYFSGIIQPEINAVPLAERFYGFDGYLKLAERFRRDSATLKMSDGTTRVLLK